MPRHYTVCIITTMTRGGPENLRLTSINLHQKLKNKNTNVTWKYFHPGRVGRPSFLKTDNMPQTRGCVQVPFTCIDTQDYCGTHLVQAPNPIGYSKQIKEIKIN